MAKILVAGKIPEIGLELLKDHDVEMYDKEELISLDELTERVLEPKGFEFLIITEISFLP
ncbi:hypothetical protein bthur0012_55100 [Bacillus thuringiensis serovar pulsiensis BGSC 4CC1]|nr:hypothetical protein bthur0012_55100 [Bacillus thuringiensis serovar pulsiensis BGSC 4CC1]